MIVCRDLTKRYVKTRMAGQEEDHTDDGASRPAPKGRIFSTKKGEIERIRFAAVDHINFTVNDGEIVGILGPNGAGKTTLLRMMSGLLEPDEGSVEVILKDQKADNASEKNSETAKNSESAKNSELSKASDGHLAGPMELKKNIGFLSNNTRLYERFSARELLRMLGGLYDQPEDVTEKRIEQIFDRLQMREFSDDRISSLSTGQKQRVSISRCFIHDPSVFIFDEPTLGLDILSARVIIEMMLAEKAAGKTVLYSTHYMEEAQKLCDRIIMLDHGKMIENAPVKDILEKTGTDNLREAFFALTEGRADA